MIDYFALLAIERRPAIAEESLKNAYFRKTESLRSNQAEADALSSLNMAFESSPILRREFSTSYNSSSGMSVKGKSALTWANYLETFPKRCKW